MRELVLVGIDPGYRDVSALQWAIEWATATDQEVLVVSGFEIGQSEVSPEFHDELLEEAHVLIDQKLSSVNRAGRAKVRSMIVEGHPTQVVIDAVHAEDPSIVVLGSRGEGGYDQLAVGGVGHRVIHELTRPVVIVRHHGGTIQGGEVIVVNSAVGDEESPALDWALGASKVTGSPLVELDAANTADVVAEACRLGDRDNAAMIVVGSRGVGSILDLASGKLAASMVERSDRPVVLIHRPG